MRPEIYLRILRAKPERCADGKGSREWGMRLIGITHLLRKFSRATTCGYCAVHMIEFGGIVISMRANLSGLLRKERKDLKKL